MRMPDNKLVWIMQSCGYHEESALHCRAASERRVVQRVGSELETHKYATVVVVVATCASFLLPSTFPQDTYLMSDLPAGGKRPRLGHDDGGIRPSTPELDSTSSTASVSNGPESPPVKRVRRDYGDRCVELPGFAIS